MVLRKKCGLPETDRDRTCPVKRSGAGNGISRSLNAQPPTSVIILAEDTDIRGPKAGAWPVKDYNACTT